MLQQVFCCFPEFWSILIWQPTFRRIFTSSTTELQFFVSFGGINYEDEYNFDFILLEYLSRRKRYIRRKSSQTNDEFQEPKTSQVRPRAKRGGMLDRTATLQRACRASEGSVPRELPAKPQIQLFNTILPSKLDRRLSITFFFNGVNTFGARSIPTVIITVLQR